MTMSPGVQRGHQHLFDIEPEALAVDRAIDEPWRGDAVMAQRGQEGHGLPMAVRHLGAEPVAAPRPSPERRHVGLGPGFVDEDQAGGVDAAAIGQPLPAPARDVGAVPLRRDQRLFL